MSSISRYTSRRARISRAGFTLPELLTVITIIALLMMASFGGLTRARALAKRTKAETQLRQMISAWEQYFVLYQEWPSGVDGQTGITVTSNMLEPLTNPDHSDNEHGVVFLNFTGNGPVLDPWGTPFHLSFNSTRQSGNDRNLTSFETSVALPVCRTLAP